MKNLNLFSIPHHRGFTILLMVLYSPCEFSVSISQVFRTDVCEKSQSSHVQTNDWLFSKRHVCDRKKVPSPPTDTTSL